MTDPEKSDLEKPRRPFKTRLRFAWRILWYPTLDLASLETPSALSAPPAPPGTQLTDDQLDLKKTEYAGTAERYENIYKAIWQNFSYMAAVAAGILTFGAKQLPVGVLMWLALLPLVFWYVATFVPLDFYGRQARSHLRRIEGTLNAFYFTGVLDPHRLSHFADFDKADPPWHVRTVVRGFLRLLTIVWLLLTLWLGVFVLTGYTWKGFFQSLSHVSGESHGTSVKIETSAP